MNRSVSITAIMAAIGVVLVLGLVSCKNPVAPVITFSENAVSFDSSGHVTSPVTYTEYGGNTYNSNPGTDIYTYTYSTDGTYEYVDKEYDSTSSSWKEYTGYKGSYSYDSKSMTMTYHYTQVWPAGFSNSYTTLTSASSDPKTITSTELLTSDNRYTVLIATSGTTFAASQLASAWDGTSASLSVTAAIQSDLSSVTTTTELKQMDSTGAVTNAQKTVDVQTISSVFPSGISTLNDAKGKMVTFGVNKSVTDTYAWTGTAYGTPTTTTSNSGSSSTAFIASDLSYVAMPENSSGLLMERSLVDHR